MNFGCTNKGVGSLANLPVPCRLSLTALDQSGKRGQTITYEYEPALDPNLDLAKMELTVKAPMRKVVDIYRDFDKPASEGYELSVTIGVSVPGISTVFSLVPKFLNFLATPLLQFYRKVTRSELSDATIGLLFDDLAYKIVDCGTAGSA